MATSRKNIKCAIYLRVSTGKQLVEGTGLEIQKEDCLLFAKLKKWEVFNIYTDDGYSGTLGAKDRPALNQLIEDAKDEKFNMVVVYKLDRIGRTQLIIMKIVDKLKRFGVGIATKEELIDTSTTQGTLLMQILGSFAEFKRSKDIKREELKEEIRKNNQEHFSVCM